MVTLYLDRFRRFKHFETLLVVLCLSGSLVWAGHAFFGTIGQHQGYQITLVTSDLNKNFTTQQTTVGDFLTEVKINPGPSDIVDPSSDTHLKSGMKITYKKAIPVFLADSGCPPKEIQCSGTTICDLLDQCGIVHGPLDRIEPSPDTLLKPGMHVTVTKVETLDIKARKEIQPPEITQPDSSLRRGESQEVTPGKAGIVEETTRVFYRNGQETQRFPVESKVLVQPEQRVTRIGTQFGPMLVSRGGITRSTMTMVATAYDPGPGSCGASADGLTATGAIARKGVCAVDPRVIPLGTRLWVEGYGYAIACDVGGAIKGNRIDVCFDTRSEALRWGRRSVEVRILE
jgi:uncharacterized protein YabE (DUF348 family)